MEAMAFSKVCTVYRLRSNYVSNDFNESGPFTKYNTQIKLIVINIYVELGNKYLLRLNTFDDVRINNNYKGG